MRIIIIGQIVRMISICIFSRNNSFSFSGSKLIILQPVKVNSKVRIHTKIVSITEKSPGRVLVKTEKSMEIEGEAKPAIIAESLGMIVTG